MTKKLRIKRDEPGSKVIEGRRGKPKHKNRERPRNLAESGSYLASPVSVSPVETMYHPPRTKEPLQPRTKAQQRYINAIKQHCLTFGLGPAGTGKTYCAAALAADMLSSGEVDRIILTRPAVEAGEQLGFLPGDVDEKFAVYIEAFRETFNQRLGSGAVDYFLKRGRIVPAPLAFMRGKTFGEDTFVILDEAQNTSIAQMKMFLTRIGENCKVVVNGDLNQSDIHGNNGLADAVHRLSHLMSVYIHRFEREDIVRSGLVRELLDCYEDDYQKLGETKVKRPVWSHLRH